MGAAAARLADGAWRFEARAMGSPLRLTVVGMDEPAAVAAWSAVVADVEATEAALSRFRAASDLATLNLAAGDGAWHAASPRLYAALAASERARRLTDGRFDARVIRALEALGEHGGVALPAPVPRPDGRPWLERNPRGRRLRAWQPADSGGIGKGLALRWAAAAAGRRGTIGSGLLLEAGGDLIARGRGPDGKAWRIGVEDPQARGAEPLAVVEVTGGSIVTSSVSVRSWLAGDGRRVHHIVDPRTGEPGGDGLLAVTVLGRDPAWAEVWSKALFLAGPAGIGPEARARGMAAWWVEADGSLHMTPEARFHTTWERAAAA